MQKGGRIERGSFLFDLACVFGCVLCCFSRNRNNCKRKESVATNQLVILFFFLDFYFFSFCAIASWPLEC